MDYTHSPLGEEVEAIGGSYIIDTEDTLDYGGRKLLYIVGGTGFMRTCCSTAQGLRFVTVPGFVTSWQSKTNKDNLPVSDVEPVRDEKAQQEIRQILRQQYYVTNVEFW